jgi:hypothetical protein
MKMNMNSRAFSLMIVAVLLAGCPSASPDANPQATPHSLSGTVRDIYTSAAISELTINFADATASERRKVWARL